MFIRLSAKIFTNLVILVMFFGILAGSPCHADQEMPHDFQKLVNYLQEIRQQEVRSGSLSLPNDFEKKAGELLIIAAEREATLELYEASLKQSLLKNYATVFLNTIAEKLNPLILGRMILQQARQHGISFAVAFMVCETVETMLVVSAVKYPALGLLTPLYPLHIPDLLLYTSWFSVPKVVRMMRFWIRHGGILGGWKNYYEHLVEQRQMLPLDLDEVIEMGRGFAIIDEGWVLRNIPKSFRILFFPKKEVLKETFPTVSLFELRKIAERAGASRHVLNTLSAQPRLFAVILLQMISQDEGAQKSLYALLEGRTYGKKFSTNKPLDISNFSRDLEALIERSPSNFEIQKFFSSFNETPDLIAQRVLWYLKAKRDLYYRDALENGFSSRQGELFSGLRKHLDGNSGLSQIANHRFSSKPSVEEWKDLATAVVTAQGLLHWIEEARMKECEVLLQ